MPPYGAGFARVYDTHWGVFARTVTPLVIGRLRRRRPGVELSLLDLGCGTGITADMAANAGFVVTGIDGSPDMLALARDRARRSRFVEAPLDHPPPGPYDVVLCLFDTLNHVGGIQELTAVFAAAAGVTRPGAVLIFDLNTAAALAEWSFTNTLPGDPPVVITARCDPAGAWAEMRVACAGWVDVQREVSYDLAVVADVLARTGWGPVRWTTYRDLDASVDHPERESRVVGECVRTG